jgi:hypothetical protein
MSQHYAVNINKDGFGLIAKIVREIKSSWKLLLTALEIFLDDIVRSRASVSHLWSLTRRAQNENFDDQEFIDAVELLHGHFLLSIDYFQRQLFYHERFLT